MLGVDEVAAHLDDRFHILTGGRRTALPRHQTLRATLDWSYELLAEPERVILRRLAIFAGVFRLEAAGAVTASPDLTALQVIDGLFNLVTKSLVAAEVEDVRIAIGSWTRRGLTRLRNLTRVASASGSRGAMPSITAASLNAGKPSGKRGPRQNG